MGAIVTSVEMGADVGELLAVGLGVTVALFVGWLAMWALVRVWRGRGGDDED